MHLHKYTIVATLFSVRLDPDRGAASRLDPQMRSANAGECFLPSPPTGVPPPPPGLAVVATPRPTFRPRRPPTLVGRGLSPLDTSSARGLVTRAGKALAPAESVHRSIPMGHAPRLVSRLRRPGRVPCRPASQSHLHWKASSGHLPPSGPSGSSCRSPERGLRRLGACCFVSGPCPCFR